VSNCVLNLSPNKKQVFKEIFRVLKKGGELYFSDVFADRRIPEDLKSDPVLIGECLSGALYIEDFRRIISQVGCSDHRIVSSSQIDIEDKDINNKIGFVGFESLTIRAFKLDLEDLCEDYGQVAYYQGGIDHAPCKYVLDDHHVFEKNKPMLVCGNSALMLESSRLKKYFKVVGSTKYHYGVFGCGENIESGQAINNCC